MTLDELMASAVEDLRSRAAVVPKPVLKRGSGARPALGWIVQLASVAAVVLVGALLLRSLDLTAPLGGTIPPLDFDEGVVPVDTEAASPADPEDVSGADPTLDLPSIEWRRVDLEGGPGIDVVEKAIPLADCSFDGRCGPLEGYVAVGGGPTGTKKMGLVWTSPDGIQWTRTATLGDEQSPYHLYDVAYRKGTLVAVGGIDPVALPVVTGGSEPRAPFIWVSYDLGVSWMIAAQAEELGTGTTNGVMRTVIATNDGFVAGGGGGLWFSEDGEAWTQFEVGNRSEDRPDIARVVEWTGGFVAFESFVAFEPDRTDRVWISEDGLSWEEHDAVGLFAAGPDEWLSLADVSGSPSGSRLVGVGFVGWIGEETSVMWATEDGVEWEETYSGGAWDDCGGTPASQLAGVATVGDWLLAVGHVGSRGDGGNVSRALVFASPDEGTSWLCMKIPSDEFGMLAGPWSRALDVVAFRDPGTGSWQILLAGLYADQPSEVYGFYDSVPVVWIGTFEG